MDIPQVTSAKDFRRRNEFVLKIDDTLTVRMRRLDMPTMLVNGLLPLPMVRAAQKFEELQNTVNQDPAKPVDNLDLINEISENGFLAMLQKFAVLCVIEPKFVHEDTGAEDCVPVSFLSLEQLLAIWSGAKEDEGALLTPAQAEEFRRPEPRVADPVLPAGAEVLAKAKLVDHVDRETISA
jgi:hypothetical protein